MIRYAQAAFITLLIAALPGAAQKATPKAKPAAATPSTTPATYVGSEACGACHEDIAKAFAKSPHEAVDKGETKHGFKGQACESCHGPGSNHVQSLSAVDIRNPAKLSPAETDRTCLTCHRNQPSSAGRIEASHARNSIACTSCHSMHEHGGADLVARKTADIT